MSTYETLGLVIAIIGLPSALFAFYQIWESIYTKKEKVDPSFLFLSYSDTMKLTDGKRLKIFFDEKEVDRVTTTYLFFWNNGKEAILREHLRAPIRIAYIPDDASILDFKVLKVSDTYVDFKVKRCSVSTLEFDFDYLDKNDGVVLGIKHSGDENLLPQVTGKVIGVDKFHLFLMMNDPFNRISSKDYIKNLFTKEKIKQLLLKNIFNMRTLYTVFLIFIGFGSGMFFGQANSTLIPENIVSNLFNEIYQFQPIHYILFFLYLLVLSIIFIFINDFLEFNTKQNFPYPKSLDINLKRYKKYS